MLLTKVNLRENKGTIQQPEDRQAVPFEVACAIQGTHGELAQMTLRPQDNHALLEQIMTVKQDTAGHWE